jgi:hypothetical protein
MDDHQVLSVAFLGSLLPIKYDKQGQQGKVAFNERSPHITQQQELVARSPGGPQTKTGQGQSARTLQSINDKNL